MRDFRFHRTRLLKEQRDEKFYCVGMFIALRHDPVWPLVEDDLLESARDLASIGAELLKRKAILMEASAA